MFTVNIILLCFFAIKTILGMKNRGVEFNFYLRCLITSMIALIYFFFMAKMSAFIMINDNGEFYKDNQVLCDILMIIVAVGYFSLVIQPILKMAFNKRRNWLKRQAEKNGT